MSYRALHLSYSSLTSLILIFTISSCKIQYPFVPAATEPLTITRPHELQASAGIELVNAGNLHVAYVPRKQLALQTDVTIAPGLIAPQVSALFFREARNLWYFGPGLAFQRNQITSKGWQTPFNRRIMDYSYNCSYLGPSMVGGIRMVNRDDVKLHLLTKLQYNFALSYNYQFRDYGPNSYEGPFDDEVLQHRLKPFFSLEVRYALLLKLDKRMDLRLSLGVQAVQRSLAHTYVVDVHYSNSSEQNQETMLHPRSQLVSLGVGIVLKHAPDRGKIVE